LKRRIGVIGAGILGLAVAYRLQQKYPAAEVVVFEKENGPGKHQSSHNSGVLHCGLYYQPGSLKARLAVEGIRSMIGFCQFYDIPHEVCGKVVVATDDRECGFLDNLAARGSANGLAGLRYLDHAELRKREPFVKAAAALLVPEEGIVDYLAVMQVLERLVRENGGEFFYNSAVTAVNERLSEGSLTVATSRSETCVDLLVACAGLHADRVFDICTGERSPLKIVPFRGEYSMLAPEAEGMVNHLVYPVPDPDYPFLGVHFTRLVHGGREVGPNAVLAFRREGYNNRDFSLYDTLDSLTYPGLLRFILRNAQFTSGEIRSSFSRKAFLAKARKLIPALSLKQLTPGTSGVRAQALDTRGALVMDFAIRKHGRQVHVLNAPSPGATASLAIAGYIVDEYVN
jgi:L-2-hydroxyglutarate oxidase